MNTRSARPRLLPNALSEPESWTEFLLSAGRLLNCRPAIVVTGDAHLELVSAARDDLAKCYDFSLPDRAIVDLVSDKRSQYRWMQTYGFALPLTRIPVSGSEAEKFAAEIGFPCLAKPALSHRWAGASNSKVIVVRSRSEASEQFRRMSDAETNLILQEYIDGPDDQFYGVMSYFDRGGRALAGVTKRKLRQFPERFGNGSIQVSVHEPAISRLANDIFQRLGYAGFGTIEFKLDARDGNMKLIELNPRIVSGLQLAIDSGCDMPWLAYRDITGANPAPVEEFRAGVRFTNIAWEAQRVWHSPSRSPMKWLRLAGDLARSRSFAAFSLRDPGPAVSLLKRAVR